ARLTQLFESVARIVDNHFPVVETHYGPGKMVRVIQYLQRDIDSRVCRLLETFKEDISLDRQLADIRDYEDHSNRNGKLGSPIPGKRGHPARRDDGLPASLTRSLVDGLAPTASTAGPGTGAHREEPAVDIKPLHPLLTELSLIVQRITLYMRFLESRAAPEVEIIVSAGASVHAVYLNDDPALLFNEAGLIRTSPLPSAVEHLSAAYIALENFILRYTARLALALEETEPDALVSAGVDDYFFVAKRSLQRALATAQPTAFKNVIYTVQTLSTHRFVPYLQRLLPASPANTTPAASHGNLTLTKHNVHTLPAHPDGTPLPAFADVGVRNQRVAVALNNFETAARYMGKLVAELRRGIDPEVNPIWAPHPAAAIRGVQDALGELAAVELRLGQLSRSLLEQFALITARPVMRTILQESYRDIKYVLSDEEYMDVKNDNLFVQRFVMKFNAVAVALQARLTPANLDLYLATALDYLVADWEKAVGLSKFNLLGAFCFDSDLRVLQQHFALYSETPLRDKFAKLGQMADVLTLEQVEDAEELWQANHLAQAMYLSADEFCGLLLNRLDLDAVRVKSLRL
ncbi:Golgi transport complex subunit 4, partial [Tieghemiomyces parasiticus]